VNRPGIAAALLAAAAAGSVAMVARQWAEPVPGATPEQICLAVADLRDALDLSSLSDQAVLRARAAHVADMLAAPSLQDGPAGSKSVARAIVIVLDDPSATVADLVVAIEPIARQCRG
jgi:class 3 adenylate cyclase